MHTEKRYKKFVFLPLALALTAIVAVFAALAIQRSFAESSPQNDTFVLEEHVYRQWGNWATEGNSVTANNVGVGDQFLITDLSAGKEQDVTMRANVSFQEGNGTGFAFGITNPDDPSSHWWSLNFFRNSETDIYIRLFSVNVEGGIGDTLDHLYSLRGEELAKDEFAVELKISNEGTLRGYLDGRCVVAVRDLAYAGGYLGILTYQSSVTYTDVYMSIDEPAADSGGIDEEGFTRLDPSVQLTNTWGTWVGDGDSVTAHNPSDGDLFAMTDVRVGEKEDLIFEADVTRLGNTNCASIVFGIDESNDPGKGWYGVNLQYDLPQPTARLFAVNKGTIGGGLEQRKYDLSAEDLAAKTHRLRIEAQANGALRAYLDGELFAQGYDSAYNGGYIGLSTFYGSFMFDNIRYKITSAEADTFQTEGEIDYDTDSYRSGYTWANWTFGENSLTGSNIDSGNQFSMSTLYVGADQNFSFSADIAVKGRSAGLGFGISQIDDPIKGWYGLIVDKEEGIARVFSENKGKIGSANKLRVSLTQAQKDADTVNIRVEGGASRMIFVYLDGVLFASEYDAQWDGGYLGFNTFFADAAFENVKVAIWDQEEGLTDLSSKEAPFVFEPDVCGYSVEVPKDTDTVTIKAEPAAGFTVRINGEETPQAAVSLSSAKTMIKVEAVNSESGKISLYYVQIKRFFAEEYRPQFHFTEKETWINDPNGLVYDAYTETYHMFYQYCEGVNNDGQFYWGHAVSKDLVNWERKDPALAPDQNGIIFSGSCVVDENNDSGWFDDSVPPQSRLVAFFTYHQANPSIGCAYSTDFGETWQKVGKVIENKNNVYGDNFRDPKVIRVDGKWLMITGGWANVRLFSSENLSDWTLDSEVLDYFGNNLQSECPDIFPLAVDGDEENVKWVITTAGTSYIVGRLEQIDGKFVFTAEAPGYKMYNCIPTWTNQGEMYATQSYYNDKTGRRILVSWMIDRTANEIEDKEWNGAQSLPLETDLITVNGMIVMRGYPVEEVETLRGTKRLEIKDAALGEGTENPLENLALSTFDLELTVDVGTARTILLEMRKGEDEAMILRYDTLNRVLTLDALHAGQTVRYELAASVTPEDGLLTLRVVMDTSIAEIFANRGMQSFHGFLFPSEGSDGLLLSAKGGDARIVSLTLWEMNSIH